ncbi:hypothetical protein AB205_0110730, partial [Aquarana catesbeiana]
MGRVVGLYMRHIYRDWLTSVPYLLYLTTVSSHISLAPAPDDCNIHETRRALFGMHIVAPISIIYSGHSEMFLHTSIILRSSFFNLILYFTVVSLSLLQVLLYTSCTIMNSLECIDCSIQTTAGHLATIPRCTLVACIARALLIVCVNKHEITFYYNVVSP